MVYNWVTLSLFLKPCKPIFINYLCNLVKLLHATNARWQTRTHIFLLGNKKHNEHAENHQTAPQKKQVLDLSINHPYLVPCHLSLSVYMPFCPVRLCKLSTLGHMIFNVSLKCSMRASIVYKHVMFLATGYVCWVSFCIHNSQL